MVRREVLLLRSLQAPGQSADRRGFISPTCCCGLWSSGGRRRGPPTAPSGASCSTRVPCLLLSTNPCPTKSSFTTTVGPSHKTNQKKTSWKVSIRLSGFLNHALSREADESQGSCGGGGHVLCQDVGPRVHNKGHLSEKLLQGLEEGE